MRLRISVVLVTALVVLACGGAIWSQTVQGVITGTITDPTGAVVPGATVTISNAATGFSKSTTTGSDGSYRFPLVPPGTYTIEIKAANFATVRASGIVVEASQTVPYNRQLELAKASQVIEVTEQSPLVQTATSELATQVDRETIINAALPDRDVFGTLPFIAPSITPGIDMSPTSGGARESGTQYMLNGAEDNDNFSEGAINMKPPLESVQDFSVTTNNMGAQYGKPGAVVSANQVSGANKFHGAIYEQNRNASLNANDFFSNREGLPKTKYIRNQFGGIIDGPIKTDKTFFAFAFDRFKILAGNTAANTIVPTSTALANVLANANGNGSIGSPSVAKQILSEFPPRTSDKECPSAKAITGGPGQPDNNGGIDPANGLPWAAGCLSFFDPQSDTQNTYYGRVDHNFSASDRLSFTVNLLREAFVDKFGGAPLTTLGPISGVTNNHFHNMALDETHTFSARIVNEVTVAQNRHFNTFVAGTGTETTPNIFIDNQAAQFQGFALGGPGDGSQIQGFVQDRWSVTDNLTWTAGRHAFKFGGGNQYGILYRNWDLGQPGFYEFANLDVVNGVCPSSCTQVTPVSDGTLQPDGTISNPSPTASTTNFTNDYPYFQETSINPATGAKASAYRHYTYHDYYAFVQDDWKLTPRLTLNLGLRWDRYGAPSEDHGILAQFINLGCNILDRACIRSLRVGPVARMWPTQNHDYGPRIGFAWDPSGKGKMAVRGGYGIYYDRIFDNIWSNGAWNPPFYALIDFDTTGGDSIFYHDPNLIGLAYDPSNPIPHPGKRVSIRTMDQNMKDASAQNYFLSIERQVSGTLMLRAEYLGSMGRHQPMLTNYNRTDGQAYNVSIDPATGLVDGGLSNRRPNSLYTGFNYRADRVSSNYNSLILEVQKRMSHGLQFQTSYTFSKELDVNSELFAGCSTVSLTANTAPYYFISNTLPKLSYGRGGADHRHAYKFNVTYEMPFQKGQKGIAGHALGGWSLGSFFQLYSGHPIDIHTGMSRFAAQTCNDVNCTTETFYLDQNGIPFNIGGDYNLDGVTNDHPVYLGSSIGAAYKNGGSPADGIFVDTNPIGCGFPGATSQGVPQAAIDFCNANFGITTPNSLFGNAPYPSGSTPFMRFGTLGRDVFQGPRFVQMDLSLTKSFKLTESVNLRFQASAQNVLNHPSFDCVDSDLVSGTFGHALCLTQSVQGLGAPQARIMSLALRLAF